MPTIQKLSFLGGNSSIVESDAALSDEEDDGDFSLPKIPSGWAPDSVSEIQKRFDVSDRLLKVPAKRQIEELYFSPWEIATRKYYEEQQNMLKLKEEAVKEIENYCGFEWKYIKDSERRRARIALDIDPVTETKRAKPTSVPAPPQERIKLKAQTAPKVDKSSATLPIPTTTLPNPTTVPQATDPRATTSPRATIASSGTELHNPTSSLQLLQSRGRASTRFAMKRRSGGSESTGPEKKTRKVTLEDDSNDDSHERSTATSAGEHPIRYGHDDYSEPEESYGGRGFTL
jgi:hypothetical protein